MIDDIFLNILKATQLLENQLQVYVLLLFVIRTES